MLKIGIAPLPIPKSKLSIKLLLTSDKEDTITISKSKNNDGILLLKPKKMLLPYNFIPANILVTRKKP